MERRGKFKNDNQIYVNVPAVVVEGFAWKTIVIG